MNGAPGRTRTDEYEFTKLALLLLRHRGPEKSEARMTKAERNPKLEISTGLGLPSDFGIRYSDFSKWCSHVDLHHELPPSQGGVQKLITL